MVESSTEFRSWKESLLVYTRPATLTMLFLGFAAGLPLLLVFSTLTAWLSDMNVSRSAIGFFGWVGITYSVKVFWAPVVDRIKVPALTRWLGQRRSWMLLGQIGVVLGLLGLLNCDPVTELTSLALFAVLVAFSASTQDIAIDAFRIESAQTEYQGAMSACYIFGYRVAMLVAGAGALYIADISNWSMAYLSMAALMGVGIITVLVIAEPDRSGESKSELSHIAEKVSAVPLPLAKRVGMWMKEAVAAPFVEFFQRNGRFALVILLFIGFYRLGDITMGIMANPFYLDLGFTKSEIASIGKLFGFFMTILGSFMGGLLVVRYGVFKPLLWGAILVACTNILFSVLALVGPDINWLAVVISADNLSAGLSNAAFIAYLSGMTHRAYTATQYALFSSLMTLPGKFFSGFSGIIVDSFGYYNFFMYAALMGLPAIVLAVIVAKSSRQVKAL